MEHDHLTTRELELLDRVASATVPADLDLSELRRLYDDQSALRIPGTVTSYSPLTGEPREITLQ